MGEKTCQLCGEKKPLLDYHNNKQIPDGKHTICKACNKEKTRAWRIANPTKYRSAQYKRKYGITYEEVQALKQGCNYTCEVCGLQETQALRGTLFVDHCHKTGRVRGMLCQRCNTILGQCEDSIETLKAAVTYLERFKDERI